MPALNKRLEIHRNHAWRVPAGEERAVPSCSGILSKDSFVVKNLSNFLCSNLFL